MRCYGRDRIVIILQHIQSVSLHLVSAFMQQALAERTVGNNSICKNTLRPRWRESHSTRHKAPHAPGIR